MANKLVGIDIGASMIKVVQVEDNKLVSFCVQTLPDHLVQDGNIVSLEAMSEIIREILKKMNVRKGNACISLKGSNVFVRSLTVPQMSEEQLLYNIPYEFKDYINEELKNYTYDYSMISSVEEMEKRNQLVDDELFNTMDVLAAACPIKMVEDIQYLCKKSNLKLVGLMPEICSYINVIRNHKQLDHEYCIVNIGYNSTNVEIFDGDTYKASRKIEIGLNRVDELIAENMNVDIHVAHTYFMNNFEKCQDLDYVNDVYRTMAIDLSRALNFYLFNYRDSKLNDVYICGGGAMIEALMESFKEVLDLNVHYASEILPFVHSDANTLFEAIGLTLEG